MPISNPYLFNQSFFGQYLETIFSHQTYWEHMSTLVKTELTEEDLGKKEYPAFFA